MSGLSCLHCGAEITNGTALCKRCQTTTRISLENIASYHADLFSLGGRVTRLRTSRGGVSDPTGNAVARSEPEKDAPDVLAAEARTTLHGWVRSLVCDRPGVSWPKDTVSAMTACLARHLGSVATTEWAGEMVRELLDLELRLRKTVERGKGRWYAGICSALIEVDADGEALFCDRDLYAIPGTSYVRCPVCRTDHSVTDRRATLLAEARETLLPLSTIAQVCVTLLEGEPSVERLYQRIHKWTQRGDLEDYGVRVLDDRRAHRVYRLGDVLDTLIRDAAKTKRGASC